jgi:hypothetical protein
VQIVELQALLVQDRLELRVGPEARMGDVPRTKLPSLSQKLQPAKIVLLLDPTLHAKLS